MTNTKTKGNYKIIYKMDYAMELIARGHNVSGTSPNPKRPLLTMWIFEYDETIDDDLKEIMEAEGYAR